VGQVDDDNDNEEGGNELVFNDVPTLTFYETLGVGEPIIYARRKATNKKSNHQMMVLLLDLPMLLRKVLIQLQPSQQGGAKRRFKLGLRINYMIAVIQSLKLLTTRVSLEGKRRRDMLPLKTIILGLKKSYNRNLRHLFYVLLLF